MTTPRAQDAGGVVAISVSDDAGGVVATPRRRGDAEGCREDAASPGRRGRREDAKHFFYTFLLAIVSLSVIRVHSLLAHARAQRARVFSAGLPSGRLLSVLRIPRSSRASARQVPRSP